TRGAGAAAGGDRPGRPDGRDGHARPAGRRGGRSRGVPGRRADRGRAARALGGDGGGAHDRAGRMTAPGWTARALRMRGVAVAGASAIVVPAAVIAAAAGQVMATALGAPGPGRFAAADAVVRANPTVVLGDDRLAVQRAALLPPTTAGRIAAAPGVRS